MQEVAIETVEIVTTDESAESGVLSELDVELLAKVGGGWLSWGY